MGNLSPVIGSLAADGWHSTVCPQALELGSPGRGGWVPGGCRTSCERRCSNQDGALAPEGRVSWEADLREDLGRRKKAEAAQGPKLCGRTQGRA